MSILTRVRGLPLFKPGRYGRAWIYFTIARTFFPLKRRQVLVLSDSRSDISGNLEFIVRELREKHPEFAMKIVLRPHLRAKRPFRDSVRLPFLIATSKFIIVDDFYPYIYRLRMRKGVHLIQAWHAAGAFKRVGYSRRGLPGGPSDDSIAHRGYTDAIVSSERIRHDYAEAFWMRERDVHALGVPRTDVFFDEEHTSAARARIRERYGIRDDQRVVLFAPTFRGNGQRVAHYDFSFVDWEALAASLGDEAVMLVKFHPFIRDIPDLFSAYPQFIDVSSEREINELLFATDVLVTDYSSVIFEFALLRRPIIFHVPDLEEYRGARDFYYPFDYYLCGPQTRTTSELIAAIKRPELDEKKLGDFVDYFMAACDGRSSERFVDQLIVARADEPADAQPVTRWPPTVIPGVTPSRRASTPLPEPGFAGFRARMRRFLLRDRRPGLLSVVMPAYNVEKYIEEAVRSVLDQSYRKVQLIVVDDSSTDGTPGVLERLAAEDPRVQVFRRPRGGPNAGRNFGIRKARGEFLTFLDGDDVLLPGAYEDMIASIEKSGSDFVVGGYERIRDGAIEPAAAWIQNAHNKDRIGIRPRKFPRIMVNAVQWSKLYRRFFWDDRVKSFAEPGFYQDQPVSARAYANAERIDVLARSTVAWRVREDRSSMTQQLGTVSNLRDRFRTAKEALSILRESAGEEMAGKRLVQFMRFDFGVTTGRLVDADDEYWAALVEGTREFVDMSRAAGVWHEISAQHRVLFQLIHDDRRAMAVEFIARDGRHPASFEIETRGDDVYIKLPFWQEEVAGLPDDLFLASPMQKRQLLSEGAKLED